MISSVFFRCAITEVSVSVSLVGCLLTAIRRMELSVLFLLVQLFSSEHSTKKNMHLQHN